MAPGQSPDFNSFINKARAKKDNEDLVNQFFGKNRRASAPAGGIRKSGPGASLASRMGVGKRGPIVSKPLRQQPKPAIHVRPAVGNVDAEWTHDLHAVNNPSAARISQLAPPRAPRNHDTRSRNERVAQAFNGSASTPNLNAQYNIVRKSKAQTSLSIKGLAGPYILLAENFAPGTTAQDIESAMSPVGGPILSCRLVSERPSVVAEIIFETKAGADCVIDTFNDQEADGNTIYVYYKKDSPTSTRPTPIAPHRLSIPSGPRADRSDRDDISDRYTPRERSPLSSNTRNGNTRESTREDVIDGSYGFDDDRMETDDRNDDRYYNNNSSSGKGGNRGQGLYSDNLVGGRGSGNGFGNGNGNNNTRGGGDRWVGGRRNDRNRYR